MILPFSIGCVSQSSVAVAEDRSSAKRSLQSDQTYFSKSRDVDRDAAEKATSNNKGTAVFLPLPPRPNLTAGFHRVIKGFRGLRSQLFAYKDRDDQDDDDDERELQIGFPTDVQHVGHIGWDGTNTHALSTMMAWDGYRTHHTTPTPAAAAAAPVPAPPDLMSVPSMSFRQFQMAMAAQADDSDDVYPVTSSRHHHHYQHQLRTVANFVN